MKLDYKLYGKVKNEKVRFELPDYLNSILRELEGCDIEVIFKKISQKFTPSQMGYYRGCILVVLHKSERFSWMDNKDQIHEKYFAKKFLTHKELVTIPREKPFEIEVTRSLAGLDKEEMSEFMTRVLADCDLNNEKIPSPESYYNKYYRK